MADDEPKILPGEVDPKTKKELDQDDKIRRAIADVYTFVRSRSINKTIASFTFDHYIDEAKRQLKGDGTAIRDASGQSLGLRPTQLEALSKLQEDFNTQLEAAKKQAEAADKKESK